MKRSTAAGPTQVFVTNPSWTVDVAPRPTSVLRVAVSAIDGHFTWQTDTGRRAVIELVSAETSGLPLEKAGRALGWSDDAIASLAIFRDQLIDRILEESLPK
jgi:hypothetical protein